MTSPNNGDDEDTTLFRRAPAAAAAEPLLHALVATDEAGETRRLALTAHGLRIGRVAGNDIVLPSPDISRQHAQVTPVGDQALLTDLGSTDGTWLDGQRMTGAVKLEPGARLVLFSDGAFETQAPDGRQRGLTEMLALLAGPVVHAPDLPERLMQQVRAASRPGPLDDDATILCVDFA